MRTHEIETGLGLAQWTRRSLPDAGGVNDQDAQTLQALEHVRLEMNRVLHTTPRRGDGGAELARFRRAQRG